MTATYEIDGQKIRVEGLPSPGPYTVILPSMAQAVVKERKTPAGARFEYRGKLYRSLRTAVECIVRLDALTNR